MNNSYDPNATPQRPPGVTRAWLIAIVAFATVVLVGLYLTRPKAKARHGDIDFKQSADDWYHHSLPISRPMPAPAAPREVPTPRAIRLSAPTQVLRAPTVPQSCAPCAERARRLQAIAASPIDLKVGANTLETPQQAVSGTGSPIIVSLKPAPPHTIVAWNYLYAVLETGVNSDHPRDLVARVSQDARDSVSQTEVLIPQGSTLHGTTKGVAALTNVNDPSLVVLWDDIALPNGGHIPLPQLPGMDASGYPGLDDQLDRHLVHQFGPVTA